LDCFDTVAGFTHRNERQALAFEEQLTTRSTLVTNYWVVRRKWSKYSHGFVPVCGFWCHGSSPAALRRAAPDSNHIE